MSRVQHHVTEHEGHEIELEFDQRRIFINQAVLRVDGRQVDKGMIFYGDKDLRTTLDDGTEIQVRLHSDLVGELARAQVRRADGTWVDLTERPA